jgi:hypothetical protein
VGNIYAEAALALQPPDLVEVTRDELDDRGVKTQGFPVGLSPEFLLLNALGDRIDLDGYTVVRLSDITELTRSFPRKSFYLRALDLKGIRPVVPEGIDLTDVRSLLASIERRYPLITIHRERVAPDECEIGRLKLASDGGYALLWITPEATWEHDYRTYRYSDITRVGFDAQYERTLALVAGGAV